MAKGCGESVCMNVLEALQDEHDVGLVTLSEPDFAELNDYFNTSVDLPALELATQLAPRLHRRYGIVYAVLQNALPSRYARRRAGAFDRLVSTINELGLPDPSVEYVHFPFDWCVGLEAEFREHIFHPTVEEAAIATPSPPRRPSRASISRPAAPDRGDVLREVPRPEPRPRGVRP